MTSFLAVLFGYVCGSIPFGLLLTRAAGLGDVRSIGSGNIGATNVLRTGNKRIAALTLFLDGLKGAVPVLLLTYYGSPQAGMIAGLAAMAGHIFPIWLDFKGGKGVATSLGVLFGLFWPLGLIFIALWLALAFAFRMSSLAGLVTSALTPLWAYLLGCTTELILSTVIIAVVIWIMHRANIARLMKGEEPKIDLQKRT
ncbi:MAG: glycerol-3-phosphate 1-O-acyltransferase PlsY [Hyphomicrobiales bacterium]|nr:glycerol-3-phosphate 1-O-acyltransferase PlsY [Hyphomicrobiales bacterium]